MSHIGVWRAQSIFENKSVTYPRGGGRWGCTGKQTGALPPSAPRLRAMQTRLRTRARKMAADVPSTRQKPTGEDPVGCNSEEQRPRGGGTMSCSDSSEGIVGAADFGREHRPPAYFSVRRPSSMSLSLQAYRQSGSSQNNHRAPPFLNYINIARQVKIYLHKQAPIIYPPRIWSSSAHGHVNYTPHYPCHRHL